MSHQPIEVDILSDDDDDDGEEQRTVSSALLPLPTQSKRQRRTLPNSSSSSSNPNATTTTTTTTVFLIDDDDPTPKKKLSTPPSFADDVDETPPSFSSFGNSFLKCTNQLNSSQHPHPNFTGISELISLESDDESENRCGRETFEQNKTMDAVLDMEKDQEFSSRFLESTFGNDNLTQMSGNSSSYPIFSEDDFPQVNDHPYQEINIPEPVGNALEQKVRSKANANKKENMAAAAGQKKIMKDERIRLMEEKKQKKERERLQNAAMKAEAAKMKKLQKERQKWEKGKFAIKSIVAEIDTKVVELGLVGGHLLTRFAEKGLIYRIMSNAIERSIVWTMTVPEEISQFSSKGIEIPYVLIIFEAEEFCNLVSNGFLLDHVSCVRSRYPSHTICYVTNKLMAYINRREQGQYKNPEDRSDWRRPPVEEVLSTLTTHFVRVHSRQCIDEAELAEHVVGLTCSLASCQFRKKLTRLSVNANGSLIPKDCIDRNLIKKSLWLKALVAIPKVQPRFAMAIWKKYPTMKSLLSVYMNPSKSVHEKEYLLKDLTTEGLLGEDRRLGEICSKRVYRILMAQCGSIKTDDVEDGADLFCCQSS